MLRSCLNWCFNKLGFRAQTPAITQLSRDEDNERFFEELTDSYQEEGLEMTTRSAATTRRPPPSGVISSGGDWLFEPAAKTISHPSNGRPPKHPGLATGFSVGRSAFARADAPTPTITQPLQSGLPCFLSSQLGVADHNISWHKIMAWCRSFL